jgi:ABC-type proline/glycine betaine transport system permease subunit
MLLEFNHEGGPPQLGRYNTLVLFGLGPVPGLISTVIFALPAPIRLTQAGIAAVPVGMGFEAGFAMVPLAIVLDRVCRPRRR